MAYSIGTATNIGDLFTKLSSFAQAQGWTEDYAASDRLFLHKSTVYVAYRWDSGAPLNVGIYHALGFTSSGTAPGSHTDDSGQGAVSGTDATIAAARSVLLVNSSMAYWFMAGTTYLHVVVRLATNDYRHFGCGILNPKIGDAWTGGEYCYGWRWNAASSDVSNLAVRTDSSMLLDALGTEPAFAGSLHLESIPNQAAGKWGLVGATLSGGAGNDRLTGEAGSDVFLFDSALSAATNIDTVTGFVSGTDSIRLDNDVFTALSVGAITDAQLAHGVGLSNALDADDRLVFDTSSGKLYYDADGAGGVDAIQFAQMGAQVIATLSAADFLVVD